MKITRKQLNNLIREHLGIKTQINEIAPLAVAGIALGGAALLGGIYELTRQMEDASPSDMAKILLDPKNEKNPVKLMAPIEKIRDPKNNLKFGMPDAEISNITNMIRKATVGMSMTDMLSGEGATNEAQIGEAIGRCACKYSVAQVAHKWSKLNFGDGENLGQVLESELNKDDYLDYVIMPIEMLDFVTGLNNGKAFTDSLESFNAKIDKSYEKHGFKKSSGEAENTEKDIEEAE